MSFGRTLAFGQQEELYRQQMREARAQRAAMLIYFEGMNEAQAIRLALLEEVVLRDDSPGVKQYDDEGHIIANLDHPELKLPSLVDQPVHVRELIEASKRDLLFRGVIPSDIDDGCY